MILCLCQRGNVRSATCATVLRDCYGEKDVIATGVQTTSQYLLDFLCQGFTRQIFVLGNDDVVNMFRTMEPNVEFVHLNIGDDQWGVPMHPDLVAKIIKELEANGYPHELPFGGTTDNYLATHSMGWNQRCLV